MLHTWRGRYLLAAIVFVLELPITAALAIAAAVTRVVATVGRVLMRPFS